MTVETIVFDFGGVLIDWNPRYLYRSVFKDEAEMEMFLTEICSPEWNAALDKGKPFKEGVAELIARHPEYAREIEMFDTHWEQMCGSVIEGTVEILHEAAGRYPVYGLTNWSAEKFAIALPKYYFFKEFKGIVVSGIEKEIKPDKRIFEILIERYGITPEKTVFIDDSKPNIETAKRLGFRAVHFEKPENLRESLKALGVSLG